MNLISVNYLLLVCLNYFTKSRNYYTLENELAFTLTRRRSCGVDFDSGSDVRGFEADFRRLSLALKLIDRNLSFVFHFSCTVARFRNSPDYNEFLIKLHFAQSLFEGLNRFQLSYYFHSQSRFLISTISLSFATQLDYCCRYYWWFVLLFHSPQYSNYSYSLRLFWTSLEIPKQSI